MTSLVRTSTWISLQSMLAAKQSLESEIGCKTLSGVQAGANCRPKSSYAALSDSESSRLGSGAARQRLTVIPAHALFGCSCKLELTVELPASICCRQVGLLSKICRARASWACIIIMFRTDWANTNVLNYPKLLCCVVCKPQAS